jgi:hypothetical protein
VGESPCSAVEARTRSLTHYTSNAVRWLAADAQTLEATAAVLSETTESITKNERMLRKYVGLMHRVRRALARQS